MHAIDPVGLSFLGMRFGLSFSQDESSARQPSIGVPQQTQSPTLPG